MNLCIHYAKLVVNSAELYTHYVPLMNKCNTTSSLTSLAQLHDVI